MLAQGQIAMVKDHQVDLRKHGDGVFWYGLEGEFVQITAGLGHILCLCIGGVPMRERCKPKDTKTMIDFETLVVSPLWLRWILRLITRVRSALRSGNSAYFSC